MAVPGVSTLKMELGYGAYTASDTKPPDSFTKLGRINSIGGIELSQENIDASAIEDDVSQYVAGRSDTGKQMLVA